MIPCIADGKLSVDEVYDRLEFLLSKFSENSTLGVITSREQSETDNSPERHRDMKTSPIVDTFSKIVVPALEFTSSI